MICPYCLEDITSEQVEDGETELLTNEEFQGLVHRSCLDDQRMEAEMSQ